MLNTATQSKLRMSEFLDLSIYLENPDYWLHSRHGVFALQPHPLQRLKNRQTENKHTLAMCKMQFFKDVCDRSKH